MKQNRRTLLLGVAALPFLGKSLRVGAQQAYPSGPITVIVPFPPGGGTDTVTRLITHAMSESNGWNMVIENRPGAGGNIGLNMVARASANGVTIGMAQTSNLAINPTLYGNLPYDALADFTPIGLVAAQPVILVVPINAPYKNLADFVAAAKSRPDKMTMGTSGSGTVTHLAGEMFARRAGVQFTHVPYKGAAPSLNDLAGGHLDFAFSTPQSVISFLEGKKLRALAVTSKSRLEKLSSIPTIAESGFADFEAEDWKALVGPAGMPKEAVKALNDSLNKALSRKEVAQMFVSEGSRPLGGTPESLAEKIKTEHAHWGELVRASGAKVQ